jgi:Fe-S-cluster containining protein
MHDEIETLIEKAAIAKSEPCTPPHGIPPQWIPSVVRWTLRILFLPFIWLDLVAQKIARWIIRPPFQQAGHCLKRGNCCHYILLQKKRGPLQWINYFWNTQINGFFPRFLHDFEYEGRKMQVMGCRYLKKDGKCAHYRLRPAVCRQWPRIEYFGRPQILKGCGFYAVDRKTKLKVIE